MNIILKYFPALSEKQYSRFKKLEPFYTEWNQHINLISRNDLENLYERHVLHSLAIGKLINFAPKQSVLDVGTGGGFPGIPLAILFPQTKFHLVDSIGKKIKVVRTLVQELELDNVCAEQIRAENLNRKFDVIVSRAVTSLPEFTEMVKGKLKKSADFNGNGIYYLKGGDISKEIKQFKNALVCNVADFFHEPFFETKLIIHLPFHTL
jgi:16S rRNA (guanine527-N7)-methyltransferase